MIHVIICSGPCHGLWWFVVAPLRIHLDIDRNMQFYSKHGVVTPYSNCLEKLTLLCEGFVQIRREFTEILTETCSFSRNMGLLPLIRIVWKS